MRPPVVVLLSFFHVGVALPFTEWLGQLVLNFANIPELTLLGGAAIVDIESGSCQNVSIGNLSVGSVTGNTSGFATDFQLDGLGLQCKIKLSNARISAIKSGPLDIDLSIATGVPGPISGGLAIPAAKYQAQLPPLPEGANLTACSAPLILNLVATGHTFLGKQAAAIINGVAAGLTPDSMSTTVCGIVNQLVDGRISETLRNVSSKLAETGGLLPAEDAPEPPLSPKATNINELMQTGVLGHALQEVVHNGRYDFSNTSQLLDIVSGFLDILQPTKSIPFIDRLKDKNFSAPLTFSLQSSLGNLTGDLALDKCAGELPSPLLKGSTTDHAQRVNTGHFSGHCGVDLQFSLIPQSLSPQSFGMSADSLNISVDVGELDVSTSLAATLQDVSIYVSMLLGINGYTMVNDFSTDQWTRPACLIKMLDGHDASNLGLLGLTGTLGSAILNLQALDQDPTIGSVLPALGQWVTALLAAYQPAINSLLQGSATHSIVNYVNEKVIQNWFNTTDGCAVSGYSSPINHPLVATSEVWTAVFGGLALIAVAVLFFQCTMRSVRKVEGQQNLLTESDQQADETGAANPSSTPAQSNEVSSVSGTVPKLSKWTMNLFLFATVGILVASLTLPNNNLQTTAMDTDPKGGGVTTQTAGNLLQFTIWSLALDMFQYGLPEVSVLIILGTVILPLVQLALMGACWNLPPSALSVKRREQILTFLLLTVRAGWLGTFLLAILVRAMQVPFTHADGAGGTARFIVEVAPESGFYAYAVATLSSMCMNEVIVATHRRATESGGKKVAATDSESGQGAAVTGNVTATAAEGGEVLLARSPVSLLVERSALTALTWFFVLVSPVLLLVGLGIESYTLGQPGSLQGALKWLLNGDVSSPFSVFVGATTFPWPTQASGVLILQVGYFFIVAMLAWLLMIAPVLLTICCAVLWAVPLTPSAQKRVMRLSEFMFNWQCLDVYAACVIVMSLLGTVLSRVLDTIVSNDSALDGTCTGLNNGLGVQCITVKIELRPGMVCLVAGILSFIVTKFLVEHQTKKVVGQ